MKTVTKYQCDVCKKEYTSEARAMDCENSHAQISGYTLEYTSGTMLPDYVTLKYTNSKGKRATKRYSKTYY